MQGARIGGEFTDDFLEDIFDRNQTLYIPVLVDDKGDAALVLAKVDQFVVSGVPSGMK